MKKILFLLILIQCICCKNDVRQADSTTTQADWQTDSMKEAHRKQDWIDLQIQKALKMATKRLPQTDWSVFNKNFYKQFVGTLNGEPASMNMTLVHAKSLTIPYIQITISTAHEMYWLKLSESETATNHKYFSLYGSEQTWGLWGDVNASITQNGDFKAFTIDLEKDILIELDFKEAKCPEATDLNHVAYMDTSQVGITQLFCAASYLCPKDTTIPLNDLLKTSKDYASWKNMEKELDQFRKKALKNIDKQIKTQGAANCNHCSLVVLSFNKMVLYNQFNNIVLEDLTTILEPEFHAEAVSDFTQFDVKQNKIMQEKDVLLKNWKNEMVPIFMQKGENESRAIHIVKNIKYGYFTNVGIVFLVTEGSREVCCSQIFIPFSSLTTLLKPDFRATYVK